MMLATTPDIYFDVILKFFLLLTSGNSDIKNKIYQESIVLVFWVLKMQNNNEDTKIWKEKKKHEYFDT